jgi:hypothetical protein
LICWAVHDHVPHEMDVDNTAELAPGERHGVYGTYGTGRIVPEKGSTASIYVGTTKFCGVSAVY